MKRYDWKRNTKSDLKYRSLLVVVSFVCIGSALMIMNSLGSHLPIKESDKTIVMLFWDSGEGWWDPIGDMKSCPLPCTPTLDRSRYGEAEMVVFLGSYSSVYLQKEYPPGHIKSQKWVFHTMESPENTPLLTMKDFMSKMDWTVTYRRDSTIPSLYCVNPFDMEKLKTTPIPPKPSNVALAAWFGTNCWGVHNNRTEYVAELMKYMKVDSYGKCMHNKDIPGYEGKDTRYIPSFYDLKLKTLSNYKFYLAFENSDSEDYVTEKIYHAYLAGTIPVYMGAPNIEEYIPFSHSYINVKHVGGPKQLAQLLTRISDDQLDYEAYFDWKKDRQLSPKFKANMKRCFNTSFCRLCAKAVQEKLNMVIG